jgi:4-aminobutyrate aminotransferase-like enzyme
MAAAIATLSVLRSEHLVEGAKEKGAYLKAKLQALARAAPGIVRDVRGRCV